MREERSPSFGEFVLQLALRSADQGFVRKKLLKKEWVVPLAAPLTFGALVFQTGAVLGYSRAEYEDALGELLGVKSNAGAAGDVLRKALGEFLARSRREPSSLHHVWTDSRFPDTDMTDSRTLEVLAKREIRLGELMEHSLYAVMFGVAYGVNRPDEFENLWIETFETPPDQTEWEQARAAGLAIPERPEIYPLKKAQEDVLAQTAAYASTYRPELLNALELRGFIQEDDGNSG